MHIIMLELTRVMFLIFNLNRSGILASTCTNETDFDTQISVYTGSCEALRCVGGNDDSETCDIDGRFSTIGFFAEQDVTYYVRVHGFSDDSGTAGVTFSNGNVAVLACEDFKSTLFSPVAETQCVCEGQGENAVLSCSDECSYCNTNNDVCASRSIEFEIDATAVKDFPFDASFTSVVTTFEYIEGTQGEVVFETADCDSSGACSTCRMIVDNIACNSCSPLDCTSGDYGYELNCTNIEANASYNTCTTPLEVNSGLFQVLSSSQFEECVREPLDACGALAASYETSFGEECTCDGSASDATLFCTVPNCIYCNSDYAVCATLFNGNRIDARGQVISSIESYLYTDGRSDLVIWEEGDNGCSVAVNGRKCNSCAYSTCIDIFGEFEGRQVNCENIETGATFDECEGISQTGMLQVFNDAEFADCNDPTVNVEEICEDEAAFEQQFSSGGTVCNCTLDQDTMGYIMTCSDINCLFCNMEGTVCAKRSDGSIFNRFGGWSGNVESFAYTGDRNDTVTGIFQGSGGCSVEVNETPCNSCEEVVCSGDSGFEFTGIGVNCENIEEGPSGYYDDCAGTVYVETGVLEVFSDYEFEFCVDGNLTAEEVCLDEIQIIGDFSGFSCSCSGPGDIGEYTLTCEDQCAYCDDREEVCGRELSYVRFNRFGEAYDWQSVIRYETGRTEEIVFSTTPTGCVVTVNGADCTSCEYVVCVDDSGFVSEEQRIQCDNVPGGSNLEACDTSSSNFEGLFAFLNKDPSQFNTCIMEEEHAIACSTSLEFLNYDPEFQCRCTEHKDSSTLFCFFPSCQFCDESETVCEIDRFEETYGNSGLEETFETYKYIRGRDETITISTFFPSGDCVVAIDGDQCSSCKEVDCADEFGGYVDLKIDCSNLATDGESITYECGDGSNVFQFLWDPSFFDCLNYTAPDTPSPTMASPTATPAEAFPPPTPPASGSVSVIAAVHCFFTFYFLILGPLILSWW